jgi:hypothetical protein
MQATGSLPAVEGASAHSGEETLFSQNALQLYTEAIQLLPRAAHVGLDLSSRLRELSGSEHLCRTTVIRAILLNQLPLAIQVSEEGKAVFWSQSLRLRSNALDVLPAVDRECLGRLFQLLDNDSTGFQVEVKDNADMEQRIEHRRQLNNKSDRLIEKICARPGFDRFMKIPTYEQLAQATKAAGGYVVALIASDPYYFALIIQAKEAPKAFSLPSMNGDRLRNLCVQVSGSGMRGDVDRGLKKEEINAQVPLEQVWRAVVEPVILHLGLKVNFSPLFMLSST